MIKNLKLTILVDNQSNREEYLSEHGFAVWIETDKKKVLFDTGSTGKVLLNNAEALGINLSTADYLVLSHGHYDHTGGIKALLKINPEIKVVCHPSVSIPRYSRQKDGKMISVGMTSETRIALKRIIEDIEWTSKPKEIFKGAYITGAIGRYTSFEDTGGSFYLDSIGNNVDMIDDDLAMCFNTPKGVIVLTGCCHSGIVNTINHINKRTKRKSNIHTLIGGFHLCNASKSRIYETINFLRNENLQCITPTHCTGEVASDQFRREYKCIFQMGSVGTQLFV